MKRSRQHVDWLSAVLHALIGFILGGIVGANWSSFISHSLSYSLLPFIVGFALIGAGAGVLFGPFIYASPGFLLLAKAELPPQSRASRIFATILIVTGIIAAVGNVLWLHPWNP